MCLMYYMTPDPITVSPGTPVTCAAKFMCEQRIRHLLVVDRARRLIGIVSDRDILATSGLDATDPLHLEVGDIMTTDPVTIREDAPYKEALTALNNLRVGALPVVANGRPVGILTLSDALRELRALTNAPST